MGTTSRVSVLAVLVAFAASGCGDPPRLWTIDGHVDSSAVADRARPLYVLLFVNGGDGTVAVDEHGIPTAARGNLMAVLVADPALPAEPKPYSYDEIDCSYWSFVVVAWSPATSAGLAPNDFTDATSFTPQPGDLVVASQPVVSDCSDGYAIDTVDLDLH